MILFVRPGAEDDVVLFSPIFRLSPQTPGLLLSLDMGGMKASDRFTQVFSFLPSPSSCHHHVFCSQVNDMVGSGGD